MSCMRYQYDSTGRQSLGDAIPWWGSDAMHGMYMGDMIPCFVGDTVSLYVTDLAAVSLAAPDHPASISFFGPQWTGIVSIYFGKTRRLQPASSLTFCYGLRICSDQAGYVLRIKGLCQTARHLLGTLGSTATLVQICAAWQLNTTPIFHALHS